MTTVYNSTDGIKLKIVLPPEDYIPWYMTTSSKNSNVTIRSGAVIELLNKIANYLKFTYEIVTSVDENYDGIVNNTWVGLVGMAQRKEVDMIVAPLTITYLRNTVIDFSDPFSVETAGIMIRVPKKPIISFWNMMMVFEPNVWLALFCSVIGAIFVIRLLYWMDMEKPQTSILFCSWLIYGTVTNQSCYIDEKTWSNRIFRLFWRIFVVLVVTLYASGLVAALTTERTPLPFQDLQGLVKAVSRREYKVTTPVGTAFYTDIMTNDLPEYKILRGWFNEHPEYGCKFINSCIEKFLNEPNVALIRSMSSLKTTQIQYSCNHSMIILQDDFFPAYLAFGFQKGSPLVGPISHAITELVGTGLIRVWEKNFSLKPTSCKLFTPNELVTEKSDTLKLMDFSGLFILSAVGIAISNAAAIFEWLWHRIHFHRTLV